MRYYVHGYTAYQIVAEHTIGNAAWVATPHGYLPTWPTAGLAILQTIWAIEERLVDLKEEKKFLKKQREHYYLLDQMNQREQEEAIGGQG